MNDQPIEHYQDGRDMAMRNQGRWYLWRNIADPDEDDTWTCWFVSVPDTGQDGPTALAELWERGS